MSNYQSLIERKLECKGRSGKNYIYACPRCEKEDEGHHLYVNYDKGAFNCFHCGYAGRKLSSLVYELGYKLEFDYDSLDTDLDKELDSVIEENKKVAKYKYVDYSRDLDILTQYFLNHTKPLSNDAYRYLLSRGLTDEIISSAHILEGVNRYGDTISIKGKEYRGVNYSGRVLVPSMHDKDRISFYVARDYIGDKTPKYLNPNQELAYSSEDVYNLNSVDSNSVIICEGVFTALSVNSYLGKNIGVATYGKSISDRSNSDNENLIVSSQGEKLLAKHFDCYYVCYDADAHKEATDTCKWLSDRGALVKYISIDPKIYGKKADVNNLTRDQFLNLLKSADIYSPLLQLERLTIHD